MAEKKALTVDEAAASMGCSGKLVRAALASGALRCVRLGARILIPVSELDRYLSTGLVEWTPQAIGRGAPRA